MFNNIINRFDGSSPQLKRGKGKTQDPAPCLSQKPWLNSSKHP